MPAQAGQTYGVNFYGFPFVNNRASKHVIGCYCPLDNRMYFQGGDTLHSATDGTWSCDINGNDWRLDVGQPVYGVVAAPHALQDGFGMAYRPLHKDLLLWPGDYFAYDSGTNPPDPAIYPLLHYACGVWKFDPLATPKYVQDRKLFGTYLVNPTGTGSPFGGVYDDINDEFMVFGDLGGSYQCARWSAATMTKLSSLPYAVAKNGAGQTGFAGAYFTRGKHTVIGRKVYIVGYRTDGNVLSQSPCFFCWDFDAHAMTELPAPVCDGTAMRDLQIQLSTSHGKVVFPFTMGPEGEINGIHVYDPAKGSWALDTQRPDESVSGPFIGNSFVSLPDGRVAFGGGTFGRQQKSMYFYEAA